MTHWKKLTNPDYLGVYSLEDGQDMILTISHVCEETVTGQDGKKEKCVVCHFREKCKPMILNATNMKMISKLYDTPYVEEWPGKKIQVGSERVKAFGEIVDALRVRKIIPSETPQTYICSKCGAEIKPMGKYTSAYLAAKTKKNYGAELCSDCALKAAEAAKNAE